MRISLLSWLCLIIPICSLFLNYNILAVSSQCLGDQRSYLLELKNSLKFNSTLSTKLVHWNESVECCSWEGVTCSRGYVVGVNLGRESISSGIDNSSSIFSLRFPLRFHISQDWLLSICLSLDFSPTLKLENPNLATLVRNLSELQELYLDGVNISAQGKEWCQALSSSLPNLRVLSMSDRISQLAGQSRLGVSAAPVLSVKVPTLQMIDLSNNYLLQGSLPEFHPNGSLQSLLLHETKFSGTLPDSIGNLKMLSRIDLSFCNFNGSIPSSIANLTQLVYLDISSNNFTGPVPSFNMAKNMTKINLSFNNLTGQITFTHWEDLQSLVELILCFNLLEGDIPTTLFSLPLLLRLELSNNQFSGQLHEFSNVSSFLLQALDLSNNNLEGPIPMSVLELRGVMPKSLANCTNLEVLDIGNNQIHDAFPCYLKDLSNLQVLVLQSNNFYGSVGCEGSNAGWPKVQIVDLSSNNFGGKLSIKALAYSKAMMANNESQPKLNYLHFESRGYYQDVITITIKGNKGLCGSPLKTTCTSAKPSSPPPTFKDNHSNSRPLIDWNFLSVELGFVFGFGMIIWPIVFCKRWRIRYCKHIDDILFKIFPQLYLGGKQYRGIQAQRNAGRRH
nr:receptor like protein 30 [Quercus suber]